MTSAAAPAPATFPWFRSPTFDFLWILGVPLLTWPLLTLANIEWGPAVMSQLILLTATGHYFATFVRAYGDADLFARFRARFVAVPIVLLLTCVGAFASGFGAELTILVAAWAFWHWLAQAFGFARIYDIKVGSFHPRTALLDKALVVAGFVGTATLTDGAVATFGKLLLGAGVPLPSAATVAGPSVSAMATVVDRTRRVASGSATGPQKGQAVAAAPSSPPASSSMVSRLRRTNSLVGRKVVDHT